MRTLILHSIFLAFLLLPSSYGIAQQLNNSGRGRPPSQTSSVVQDETIHEAKMMVMVTPHYVQNFRDEYHSHWGFGLAATYKWFVGNESPIYLGAGIQFTRHNLKNSGFDDLLEADKWLYTTDIAQYGVNLVMGRYFRIFPFLFGDIYGGFGYRYSITNTTDGKPHSFSNNFFDLDRTGLTVVVGIRVGVML
jgi:hypothetical protein